MKFRLLLWAIGFLLKRALKRNPKLQAKVKNEQVVFQIQTQDARIVRHYQIDGLHSHTQAVAHDKPDFSIIFNTADMGYQVLTSKDKNAFMRSIQDKHTQVQGDLSRLLWFQGIIKYLKW